MVRCSFTGDEIAPGTGKMYVRKDGKILYFKDRRAEKNFIKLGRNPRTQKYTRAARDEKRQHMAELKHEAQEKKKEVPAKKAPAKKNTSKKAEVKA